MMFKEERERCRDECDILALRCSLEVNETKLMRCVCGTATINEEI